MLLLSDGFEILVPATQTERIGCSQLESLTDLANRASVVIYTMDARGETPIGLQAQDNVQIRRRWAAPRAEGRPE